MCRVVGRAEAGRGLVRGHAVGGDLDEVRIVLDGQRPAEVRHEDEDAVQHAEQQRIFTRVVPVDFRSELAAGAARKKNLSPFLQVVL